MGQLTQVKFDFTALRGVDLSTYKCTRLSKASYSKSNFISESAIRSAAAVAESASLEGQWLTTLGDLKDGKLALVVVAPPTTPVAAPTTKTGLLGVSGGVFTVIGLSMTAGLYAQFSPGEFGTYLSLGMGGGISFGGSVGVTPGYLWHPMSVLDGLGYTIEVTGSPIPGKILAVGGGVLLNSSFKIVGGYFFVGVGFGAPVSITCTFGVGDHTRLAFL